MLAFLLAELLVIQYTKLPFEYDYDFIVWQPVDWISLQTIYTAIDRITK